MSADATSAAATTMSRTSTMRFLPVARVGQRGRRRGEAFGVRYYHPTRINASSRSPAVSGSVVTCHFWLAHSPWSSETVGRGSLQSVALGEPFPPATRVAAWFRSLSAIYPGVPCVSISDIRHARPRSSDVAMSILPRAAPCVGAVPTTYRRAVGRYWEGEGRTV